MLFAPGAVYQMIDAMKKFLFASLFMLVLGSAQADALYILFEPACMDRLEYTYSNVEGNAPYVAYHINVNPGEKIVLELGVEDKTLQPSLPAQLMRCSNTIFDERLVNEINSKIRRVFMVVRIRENTFLVSPVVQAARYLRAEDFIFYDSPQHRFQFDLKMGIIGENIAFKNPKSQVFFEGKLHNDCSGAFLFHQYTNGDAKPHTDLVLIPEIGIVELRNGINAEDAMRNILRLNMVNSKPVGEYLQWLCQSNSGQAPPSIGGQASQPAPSSEFITIGANPQPSGVSSDLAARGGQQPTAAPAAASTPSTAATTHTVQKGETLFRISKNYGVTVEQLKQWNNKGGSNTIFPGEKLRVSQANNSVSAKVPAGGAGATSSYDQVAPIPTATTSTENTHRVAAGETMASIALRYGYTEARLRQINNIGRSEMPRIGQVLKTSDCDCPPTAQPALPPTTLTNLPPDLSARSIEASSLPTEMNAAAPARPGSDLFYYDAFRSRGATEDQRYLNTPYFVDRPAVQPQTAATSSYSNSGGRIYDGRPSASDQAAAAPVNINQLLPRGSVDAQTQPASTTTTTRTERSFYVVQEGDSLFRIGRMYGVTVEHLRSVNNFSATEVIIPGQKVFIQ
jgi:LysM repeat protein